MDKSSERRAEKQQEEKKTKSLPSLTLNPNQPGQLTHPLPAHRTAGWSTKGRPATDAHSLALSVGELRPKDGLRKGPKSSLS